MAGFLLFFVFFGLVVFLIIHGHIKNKKRREAIVRWSSARGLHYNPDKDYGMEDRFSQFSCLKQGSSRYAYNILQGDWSGRPFLGFDYHYSTTSTNSKGRSTTHHHTFSAVIIESDVPMKSLTICTEGLFDKLAGFFGFDDIDFESAEFSDEFKVNAENRKWAYDVLHARTMEFLLHAPRFSIEFSRNQAIAWRGSRFDIAEYESAVDVITGILDRLPDYVRKQRTEASS